MRTDAIVGAAAGPFAAPEVPSESIIRTGAIMDAVASAVDGPKFAEDGAT